MSDRSVVLMLHDQFMDARIWGAFADVLATHTRPVTVPVARQQTVYPTPRLWINYLEEEAWGSLKECGSADLTVGTGWSAGVALSLVASGLSRLALLLNPQPVAAASDEDWQAQLDAASPVLSEEDRRLAEQVVGENMDAVLPFALEGIGTTDLGGDSDWLPLAIRLADRCTVAFSGHPGLHQMTRERLTRESPELPVIDLGLRTWLPWLEDPDRIDELVRHLLARRN